MMIFTFQAICTKRNLSNEDHGKCNNLFLRHAKGHLVWIECVHNPTIYHQNVLQFLYEDGLFPNTFSI